MLFHAMGDDGFDIAIWMMIKQKTSIN